MKEAEFLLKPLKFKMHTDITMHFQSIPQKNPAYHDIC